MSTSSAPSQQHDHLEGVDFSQLFSQHDQDTAAMPASSRDHYDGVLNRRPVGQMIDNPPAADPVMNTAQEQPALFTHNVPLQRATAAVIAQPHQTAANTAPQAAECLLGDVCEELTNADQHACIGLHL